VFVKSTVFSALLLTSSAFAQAPAHSTVVKMEDGALKSAEREIVSLAEAMPADKYDFAPTTGEFKGVRTFGHQMAHIAAVNYLVSASILGEKGPVDPKDEENGPASLKDKDAIVQFMKGSFAYAHKALATLTDQNFTEIIQSPFGDKEPRGTLAEILEWHSFDHYGQAVVYARMNGIIPPASRH
jgi:hypothetical protein